MKILQAITSLRIGGAEKLITEIAPLLREKGHEVDVLAIDGMNTHFKKSLMDSGIRIISFCENRSVYNVKFFFKMAQLMKNYDIVHTHITAPQFYGAFGSYFCKAKMVTTEHATSNRRRGNIFFKLMDKWMYSRYNKIISISEPCDECLKAYLGTDFPFCVIKNGINTKRFTEAKPALFDFKGGKKITMVAGFRYEKDQHTLIRALSYLPDDYHILLVGDGVKRMELEGLALQEQNLKATSIQEKDGLKTIGRIHFLGIRGDIPQILKASDVIVMSSHREGLSLSNVEGMCSGHPFVASDVEGLREVTKGYGLLFPHGNSKVLAETIIRLCTDKSYSDIVALKCKERAIQYDIQKMVDEYENVYKSLM